MLKSLRAKVLLLTAGFGFVLALALAYVMYGSVFRYYSNWQYERTQQFLERILLAHPDLWKEYNDRGALFGEQLRQYILYSPNTGLYLLDLEGRVLATAGEGKIFWSSYKVGLQELIDAHHFDPKIPKFGDDPDIRGAKCLVALFPVISGEHTKGYLYAVARDAEIQLQRDKMLESYAIRTSIKVALITLAVGLALTAAVLASFTRPISRLTDALESIRKRGFAADSQTSVPELDRNDEIGRLSQTFDGLFARLKSEMATVKEVDLQRREMIASVSHDLRTPLTALSGQLETIRLKGSELSSEERLRFVDLAFNNAQHLKRLTDSLAELSKLDNPAFEARREPIALGELADDLVQRYQEKANQQGVQLHVDYPMGLPLIDLDAGLVERALSNLLDNAMRVTPSGGTVTVQVARESQDKHCAQRLRVTDTGPGISEEDQARIFEKFFQTSKHREHRGSSGLGLTIVKRIAELHQGRVELVSKLSQGASFSMIFPSTQAA